MLREGMSIHRSAYFLQLTLYPEVQDVIWKCIQGLSSDASIKNSGEAIQAHLVKALESSSQWVNLYEATGQLHVPDLALDPGAPTANVQTVKKVSEFV